MHILAKILFSISLLSINCEEDYHNYEEEQVCYKDKSSSACPKDDGTRYLFYDVNPSEGFNLRRDVYRRFAVLAKHLAASNDPRLKNFKLVLPPWSHLYHWSYSEQAELIPWGYYFDLESLKSYAPVIEMYEFFQAQPKGRYDIVIDEVYVLQNFEEMLRTGHFTNKMQVGKCKEEQLINYLYYSNITSNNVKCLKFHGPSTHLTELLLESSATTILFAHAEVAFHPTFGDSEYWEARRSLRYNVEMNAIARAFRKNHLASTDEADNVFMAPRWQDDMPKRTAVGGPYLGVHMRRRDFFIGRPKELPTLKSTAKQIAAHLQKLGLSVVFLATDAPPDDIEALKFYLPKSVVLIKYTPDSRFVEQYRDGGTAIIDQLICAHSRFFLGTSDSTFTFRIFEEREILGFPSETTYNVLCANESDCRKPTVWKIVY